MHAVLVVNLGADFRRVCLLRVAVSAPGTEGGAGGAGCGRERQHEQGHQALRRARHGALA